MNGLGQTEMERIADTAWRRATRGEDAAGLPAAAEPAFDLVVADASWAWTERLFAPLSGLGARVLLLKACDWRTALQQGRSVREWGSRFQRIERNLSQHSMVLPPGWMKSLPQLGMRPLARAVRAWRGDDTGRPLVLAMSYPHYLHLSDMIGPDALIYYNMDDYALYWRRRSRTIRAMEEAAVERADLSVFCARVRADSLRQAIPHASARIFHLPHGAPAASIHAQPLDLPECAPADMARLPRPLLGFVGSLEDRMDWALIDRLAGAFPSGSIVLIGRRPRPAPSEDWAGDFTRASARRNVHFLGWRGQAELDRYIRAFDVCMIPYRVDHPFNHVACPTKIMDYMASSRPIVSTNLPECALYSELFDVCDSHAEFVDAARAIVSAGSDDGKAAARWGLARANTWEKTSARLLRLFLDRTHDPRLAALA